jgi:UDP-N-acetylmuramoylalanine--D-glutamate ligase
VAEDRASQLARLRADVPTFVYEDYAYRHDEAGALHCTFRFRAGDITFQPTSTFTFEGPENRAPVAREVLDNLVFHLGLAELPSYWKATCSPRVEIQAGSLGAEQIAFWTWVLTEGMGEFHYANQTPFTDPDFVTLSARDGRPFALFDEKLDGGHVIPIGGGKDSLVTLDLLGRHSDELSTLVINPPPSTEAAIRLAGITDRVIVSRRIDPRLLELNRAGYLNGHTPFGVVIAFHAALAGVVRGRKHLTLSNESSSDYSPLLYRGRVINHQVGKSWALETALHRYLAEHLARDLYYFSLLRPFNELQIAQRFSELTHFHSVFRSCNRGRATDSWCGRCTKCLSTYLVLAPFLSGPALHRIFGRDLLLDPDCLALLPSLLSEDGAQRPFECVATPAEIRAALALHRGERLGEATLLALTQRAVESLVPTDLALLADAALRPRVTPLLARAAVGVLGLGLEGTSTCRHLLSTVDPLDLAVLDDDPRAARRLPPAERPSQTIRFLATAQSPEPLPTFDILFKSPGVPPDHPVVRAHGRRPALQSSNTELFFEQHTGTLVGVTGTKGKSTTTSLIAHVLLAAGKDARLIGNIGRPCLDDLGAGNSRTIYCVELSSFQLETLRTSPHVAVVLRVFGDHLDRYGDLDTYAAAKASITRYQRRDDLVLYNADCPRATALAALSAGRRLPFTRVRPDLLGATPSPLLGAFNYDNLWPAILVGRHFGIDDDTLAAAIQSFRPLPGRLEEVAHKDGIRFICDIRSTAPEVTVAALDALAEKPYPVTFLLLGGVDRSQDYRTLLPALERSTVRHVVLFPPTGARIRALLEGSALMSRLTLFEPHSMEEAIQHVYRTAPPGEQVCLMSTAAPSNGGLFRGPEDKARQFAEWARKLGRSAPSGQTP